MQAIFKQIIGGSNKWSQNSRGTWETVGAHMSLAHLQRCKGTVSRSVISVFGLYYSTPIIIIITASQAHRTVQLSSTDTFELQQFSASLSQWSVEMLGIYAIR